MTIRSSCAKEARSLVAGYSARFLRTRILPCRSGLKENVPLPCPGPPPPSPVQSPTRDCTGPQPCGLSAGLAWRHTTIEQMMDKGRRYRMKLTLSQKLTFGHPRRLSSLIEPPVREDRRRGWPNVSFCDRVSFMRYLLPLSIICSIVVCLHASPADKPQGWGPVQSLVGDWTGEGGGGPGQGSGTFSFKPDLQGKILVRRNRAEYPATKERAAF